MDGLDFQILLNAPVLVEDGAVDANAGAVGAMAHEASPAQDEEPHSTFPAETGQFNSDSFNRKLERHFLNFTKIEFQMSLSVRFADKVHCSFVAALTLRAPKLYRERP